jgi:hypothetical protein
MKKRVVFRSVPIVVKSDRVFFHPTVYTGTAPSARIYVNFVFGTRINICREITL